MALDEPGWRTGAFASHPCVLSSITRTLCVLQCPDQMILPPWRDPWAQQSTTMASSPHPVAWSCGLSALSRLSFPCLIISSSRGRRAFYSSMCILQLLGNLHLIAVQMWKVACNRTINLRMLHSLTCCFTSSRKKGRYLRNDSGMNTYNQPHF